MYRNRSRENRCECGVAGPCGEPGASPEAIPLVGVQSEHGYFFISRVTRHAEAMSRLPPCCCRELPQDTTIRTIGVDGCKFGDFHLHCIYRLSMIVGSDSAATRCGVRTHKHAFVVHSWEHYSIMLPTVYSEVQITCHTVCRMYSEAAFPSSLDAQYVHLTQTFTL